MNRISNIIYLYAINESKKKFLKEKYDLSDSELDQIEESDPTKEGKYSEWLVKQYKKSNNLPSDINKYLGIFKTLSSRPNFSDPKDINKYKSIEDLVSIISKYEEKKDVPLKQLDRELVPGSEVFIRGSNFTWYKITGVEASMELCEGTDWCTKNRISAEYYMAKGPIYVLYINGKPEVIVSLETKEIKNRNNRSIGYFNFNSFITSDKNLFDYISKLFKKLGIEISNNMYEALFKYLGVKNSNSEGWLDLTGIKVGESLDLSHSEITKLPAGLFVRGNLDLYNCKNITKLPAGLFVGGWLDLRSTKITELPAGLHVGGSLYLRNCKNITELPADLQVGDGLDLRNTNITELPAGLRVGNWLDLRNTKITKLPADLQVVGEILKDF